VTDYQNEPRYQDWYSWNVWDWGHNRTVVNSGHDIKPFWPPPERLVVPLGQGEKERQRKEEWYEVQFLEEDGETHSMKPKSFQEFSTYPIGRRVKLRVGLAHGVEVLPYEQ
jgi:hypothetical protein